MRLLAALERDVNDLIREAIDAYGALRPQHYWGADVLHADLLRREAYAALGEKAPELRMLRLLRGDSFYRLGKTKEADAEFELAVAGTADQVAALLERAKTFETLGLRDRADADLAEAARLEPTNPLPWASRGRLLAARGDGSAADEAYARAAALAPNRLDPFLEAGWWIAGPYSSDMSLSQPPESDPDPSRPIWGDAPFPVPWKPVATKRNRLINFSPIADQPKSSIYALAHLFSETERTALVFIARYSAVRLWLNGRVVFDSNRPHTYRRGPDTTVPVTLRRGATRCWPVSTLPAAGTCCGSAATTTSWIEPGWPPTSADGAKRPI